jgi:hypothetical protein
MRAALPLVPASSEARQRVSCVVGELWLSELQRETSKLAANLDSSSADPPANEASPLTSRPVSSPRSLRAQPEAIANQHAAKARTAAMMSSG